jgi:ComF family protein
MLNLVDSLLDTLFPQRCVLCTGRTHGFGFCTPCLHDLPWLETRCAACGGELGVAALCPACTLQPQCFPAVRVRAALHYAYPVDRLFAHLKYRGGAAFARPLGEALAICLAEAVAAAKAERRTALCSPGVPPPHIRLPEIIVPVPLHPRREAERGYNQAALLAAVVARAQGLPVALNVLRRCRDAPPQVTLSRAARLQNLAGSFTSSSAVRGCQVALLDDVMTTGATARAAAAALAAAGAERIEFWCVARTAPK